MARFFFTQQQNIEMIVKGGTPSGGAVTATLVWMEALNELGHEIIQARAENDNRPILEEFSWIQICKIYDPNKGIPKVRWLTYRLRKYFIALKNIDCDYVFESIPTWTSYFLGLICLVQNKKLILRVANDNILDERFKLTHSIFERKFIFLAFRISSYILAQNNFQYNSLKKMFPRKKILKISNPYIVNRSLKSMEKEYQGYIAWVANFRYQKNPELLYKIASRMTTEDFKVAGKPISTMDKESGGFIEKLKKLPNVEFVGVVRKKEILTFFSKAKFLLNTSRYEGFSNTFLEAMSTGTPILTTHNVNPDGIINRFDLGIIYENEVDLQSKLETLSESSYIKKSHNCLHYIEENHDHLALGRTFLKFLKTN